MALTGVFHKTEKGVAQMAARTIKLAPMTRMAMVMIDGIQPVAALAGKLGGDAPAQAALNQLLAHELIEEVVAAGGAAAPLPATAPALAPPAPAMMFEALRTWASRAVAQAMGPMGDDYCLAIERARTADDLRAAAGRAREGMEGIAGGRKAAVFWSEFQQHRGT